MPSAQNLPPNAGDLTPARLKAQLRAFKPAGAAFVLHLSQCERCRGLAARFLATARYPDRRSPFEVDFAWSLSRLAFQAFIRQASPDLEDDLQPSELEQFLSDLEPSQTSLIRHLLECDRCRKKAAEALDPNRRSSRTALPNLEVLSA
jgi:bacterioferritin-associated ferredoxin